jgi:hypothetical protein
VPKTLVIDNLRAAVTRTDWYDPELNAKVAEFCRHYPLPPNATNLRFGVVCFA